MIWLAAQLWPAALISLVLGFVITWFTVVKPADHVMATRSRASKPARFERRSRAAGVDPDDESDDADAADAARDVDAHDSVVERETGATAVPADDVRRSDRDGERRVADSWSLPEPRATATTPAAPVAPIQPQGVRAAPIDDDVSVEDDASVTPEFSADEDVTHEMPTDAAPPKPAPRKSGVGSAFAARIEE